MIKTKVAFLEGRLLSSQSEQLEKFSKALIGWKKAGPPIKPLLFDHVNRLIVYWAGPEEIMFHFRLVGQDSPR